MSTFEHRLKVRYMEVDAQGVVFNAWYLTYFDDAMSAYLQRTGVRYEQFVGSGYDTQVVNADISWSRGLRWQEEVAIEVRPVRVGNTSFVLEFTAKGEDGAVACKAAIVYVVIAADTGTKTSVPRAISDLLT